MSLADERMLADPANFNVTENPVITKARLGDLAASGDEVSIKEYEELLKKKPILKYVDKNGAFSLDAFKERIGKPDFVPLPEESVRALTSELEMLQGQVGMGKKTLARIAQIEKALEYQPEYFKTKFRVGKWIEENAFEKRTLKAATPEARIALAKKYASSVSDAEVEDAAQKIFERDFPGAKLKDVENGRFDEVESLLEDYGIKGQDAVDFRNGTTFTDISDKLEERVGYLQRESSGASWTAKDLQANLKEDIVRVQNELETVTDASDKAILEGELEELKEMAVVNELIENNTFTGARAMVTGIEEPDMQGLYNDVLNKNGKNIYAVTGTGDNLKTWQRTDFRTDWEKYLENARKRVGTKIMEAQQRAVKKDLAGRMVAMVNPKTLDDKIRVTKESDDAIEAVVRSSDIDTGGQLTGAEEQLSTVFGRDTMVADIDPETLGTILDEMGVKGLGKERIITAVGAFKAEMAQEEQLNQQLIEWLSKSAVGDAQKQEIVDLVGSLKGSATLDFSIKENRKAMLKNVLTLEQKIDEVGKMDAQAGKMAAFLKEALTRPMKDHAAGWLRRQKTGLDTLGYLGVGHRSMDVAEELQKPGIGKMVSEADRVVYNEATAKAYNAVIGSDGYKLKDDVDSFAEDIIGYQIKQDGRLYALQNNTVEILKTIKEGNAGPGIVIAKDGVGLNPKEWKLVKDIPIFKDAQVYVKNEIYPEFEAMGKFYADKEPRDFMKYAKFINNIWKGVQTGGGTNLPQIKGKVYEQAKRMGMQGFIDYYNSNMAFLPLSHAFTSRNILGNYIAVKLNTGMSNKEVWEYLNKAAQVQRSLKAYMGEEDMNQGLWGILKGGYSQKQLETLVGDLKASGIPETSYKAQEGMGAITDSLGELGKGKQIVKDITEGLVEGRSMKYNESMENLWKTMVFLYERDSGKSIQDATRTVHKALFDYSALTPFEKEYIKPYTVFYTWTKKNVEMMLDIMTNKPQTFKAYAKGTLEPRGQFTNMTPEEQAQMPEWTRNTIGIPYKSNGNSKFLSGYGGNLESLSEWVGSGGTDIAGSLSSIGQQSIDMLAPTFKVPFNTLITKRNTFKDVPLDEDTSAYGYRALPKFMRNALGITQRKWVDRNGKEGVTYEMDGNKKYLIESSLGRATTVPLKVLSALSGEDKPLSTASDLFLGGKVSSYESDYLNYKSEKDKNEKIMEQLKRLGLVTQYTGYGYNSQGAALNEPNIEEYLKQLQLQQ